MDVNFINTGMLLDVEDLALRVEALEESLQDNTLDDITRSRISTHISHVHDHMSAIQMMVIKHASL